MNGLAKRNPISRKRYNGIAAQGRYGDTELAHVNPQEKLLLKALGGSGTRNPNTGLPEYYGGMGGSDARGGQANGSAPGGGPGNGSDSDSGPGNGNESGGVSMGHSPSDTSGIGFGGPAPGQDFSGPSPDHSSGHSPSDFGNSNFGESGLNDSYGVSEPESQDFSLDDLSIPDETPSIVSLTDEEDGMLNDIASVFGINNVTEQDLALGPASLAFSLASPVSVVNPMDVAYGVAKGLGTATEAGLNALGIEGSAPDKAAPSTSPGADYGGDANQIRQDQANQQTQNQQLTNERVEVEDTPNAKKIEEQQFNYDFGSGTSGNPILANTAGVELEQMQWDYDTNSIAY